MLTIQPPLKKKTLQKDTYVDSQMPCNLLILVQHFPSWGEVPFRKFRNGQGLRMEMIKIDVSALKLQIFLSL